MGAPPGAYGIPYGRVHDHPHPGYSRNPGVSCCVGRGVTAARILYIYIYLSIHLSIYLSIYVYIHVSIYLSIYLYESIYIWLNHRGANFGEGEKVGRQV